jgi:hypothetical protein
MTRMGRRPGMGVNWVMLLRRAAWVAVAGLVTACTAAPTVDVVIARHLDARGGVERIAAVQSLRLTGRATAGPAHQAHVRREIQRPGRIRTEFTLQGVTAVRACDGEACWQVAPLQGVIDPEHMPPEATREALEQADIDGPLVDWKGKGHQVILVGRESLDGREVFRLETTLADGTVRHDLIDGESHLLLRTEAKRLLRGRLRDATIVFDDYREVDGLLFAHSIEVTAEGAPNRVQVKVEKVEVNPALDVDRFRMPGEEATR